MGRIHDFLKRYKTTVDRQVDITSEDLLRREGWLVPYMPLMTYTDYDLMVLKAKQNRSIAHIVGFEGEIPASKAGDLSVTEAGMIKIAKSHVYTEEDMKLMRKWQENVQGVPNQIKDYFFGTVTSLPQLIEDTHTVLTVQGMYSGTIAFVDLITGQRVELTWTTDVNQFPADLAGAERWNQSTGTPINNLTGHARYFRVDGRIGQPAVTLMNENTYDFMVDTSEFRTNVAALRNVDASTATSFKVSEEDVDEIFRRNKIPPIQLVNETYEEESDGGRIRTEKYFIPDGQYMFAWQGMGERALGPVESNNGQPGIYTFSEEVSKEPPVDRSLGVATGTPLIFDTRKLGGRKVY